MAWLDVAAALTKLGSTRDGLDGSTVESHRREVGRNDVARDRPVTWHAQLVGAFVNPFNILLTTLAIVSGVTGDRQVVVVIALMVLLSTGLRFVQEFRSRNAAAALRAMVHTTAAVTRRDNAVGSGSPHGREIPISELVPGDIVSLSAGDLVPADVRIIVAKDLFISQSSLTGESLPVEKIALAVPTTPPCALTELPTICFFGSTVVSGTATGVVAATGARTSFGALAQQLVGQRATTAFDVGVSKVSWLFIRFTAVMVPAVIVLNGLARHNWIEALLFGLAVAVGLTPEMLPMIVTTNLAKGAVAMARHKAIVKRLSAIQNFGAMDVLCTDKTGTLTEDRVALERYVDPAGAADDWVLSLAYLNSYYQTGLKNLLDAAVLAHGELRAQLAVDHAIDKVDEIPFDFARRRMSVVVSREQGRDQLICKGAVEELVGACTNVRSAGAVTPFDGDQTRAALETAAKMNHDGLRVVAVAYREFETGHGAYSVADEAGLTLAGFIAFLDPPKATARPALSALAKHGVTVKILTGDNDIVSRRVCGDVGLPVERIVLGAELAAFDDNRLGELAETVGVFCKLTPADKIRIVQALRRRGHTVGYMGDGINDAGALREADVGISVDTGVDIAKESADIILLEKSLMALDQGVLEGRKTFGNTIKYIKMTASSNFGNVLSIVVASVFLPFLPMLPIQLLSLNLLYDFSQTSIPWDTMDADYLTVPRKWRADDIGRFMLWIGPASSLFDIATFVLLWKVFKANAPPRQSVFQSGWFIESLCSQTLIVHLIRTAKIPFVQSRAAWPVVALTAAVAVCGMALPFSALAPRLGLQAMPPAYFAWLAGIVAGYAVLMQLVKSWYIRKFGTWL